jgi:hypothetical protein
LKKEKLAFDAQNGENYLSAEKNLRQIPARATGADAEADG